MGIMDIAYYSVSIFALRCVTLGNSIRFNGLAGLATILSGIQYIIYRDGMLPANSAAFFA
jgi:hypothetical protein